MINFITSNLLWTQGIWIAIPLIFCLTLSYLFVWRVRYLFLALFIFSFYFFRNPVRTCNAAYSNNTVIVCPADGKVVDIARDVDGYTHKISIFLSPLDVHVNWVPIDGTVQEVIYKPGTFSLAFLPKSSALNERNEVVIQNSAGDSVLVRQIAGTVARRICCWVDQHQMVTRGQKFGMIRFGSRVDVLLPKNVTLNVGLGQRVYGGQTVFAYWKK